MTLQNSIQIKLSRRKKSGLNFQSHTVGTTVDESVNYLRQEFINKWRRIQNY